MIEDKKISKNLWKNGERLEESWKRVKLGEPYKKACENLRKAIAGRKDFDPITLFIWGTMMAKGVLEILKRVEEKFGVEGQKVVREALNDVGYDAIKQLLEDSQIPKDLSDVEKASFIATAVNTILYSSLEAPRIIDENTYEFDILWCPHQDTYTAFDCRVQRYFVEGMLKFFRDKGLPTYHIKFTSIIPAGAKTCHFIAKRASPNQPDPWFQYSEFLQQRALKKLEEDRKKL